MIYFDPTTCIARHSWKWVDPSVNYSYWECYRKDKWDTSFKRKWFVTLPRDGDRFVIFTLRNFWFGPEATYRRPMSTIPGLIIIFVIRTLCATMILIHRLIVVDEMDNFLRQPNAAQYKSIRPFYCTIKLLMFTATFCCERIGFVVSH